MSYNLILKDKKMKSLFKYMIAVSVAISLFGCENQVKPVVSAPINSPNSLKILAGSEVKDMEPLIRQAEKALNISVVLSYSGTIEGVEKVQNSNDFDAAWFSQSKYFYDSPESAKKIKISEKIMLSPVVVGIRQSSYQKLSLKDGIPVSWADISSWVTKNKLTYAMTDPSESNTGYVALMGVSYSLAGKGESLRPQDVNKAKMKDFFQGHLINSGSSGWLVDAFAKSKADFIINYESSLLQYNKQNPQDQLVIIYPFEGIVTSDYPMLLLEQSKSEQYKKLTEYLKSPESQKWIVENVSRRSINSQVMSEQKVFNKKLLIEMPFSPSAEVSEQLLAAYYNDFKKPSVLAFVLDTSGSMSEGTREKDMKDAIANLTVNVANNSRFAKLREREKVYVIPFSSEAYDLKKFDIGLNEQEASNSRKAINGYVSSLSMGGATSIFSSTLKAVKLLKEDMNKNPEYRYSVIVFTDGVSNEGISASEFAAAVKTMGLDAGQIRVFSVLFGEGSKEQLEILASSTGGRVFDGKSQSLSSVFKQIRSFQ